MARFTKLPDSLLYPKGEVMVQKQVRTYRTILIVRTIGNFIFLFSLFLLIRTFYIPLYLEAKYSLEQYFNKKYVIGTIEDKKIQQNGNNGALKNILANLRETEILIPKDSNFSIMIPKIGANENIVENVDAANEREYLEKLKLGVGHAKYTKLPGQGGNIFLFAHSTDYAWNVNTYNAVFYLLYKLEPGDEVNVFRNGKRYKYIVEDKKIIEPTEVQYLTRETDFELLTLQTCWPPGTSSKRLLVFAKLVNN
jgi:LPXTG-site transpeptidase (sortase) family protein